MSEEGCSSKRGLFRLLLVLPNRNFRDTLLRILGRCGYSVDGVESAEEALAATQAASYDAILIDAHLPGTTCGLTLMRQLRQAGLRVPVIVLTEQETLQLRDALQSVTGATCIRVPLDVDGLKEMIARHCGG